MKKFTSYLDDLIALWNEYAGGWTGGSAQYHKIQMVWEDYKKDADAELLAEWEEMNK